MMSARLTQFSLVSVALLMALDACSTAHPTVSNPKPESRAAIVSSAPKKDLWLPQQRSSKDQYSVLDSSTVTISNDSTSKALPIVSMIFYSIAIDANPDGKTLATLTVRRDSSITDSPLKNKNPGDELPRQEFQTTLTDRNTIIGVQLHDSATCAEKNNSVAAKVLELITPYPSQAVKIGADWSDTVATTTCRGKTPLLQQSVLRYRVIQFLVESGRAVTKVQRDVATTLSSLRSQRAGNLTATGTGSGTALLYLDRESGLLLHSDAESTLQLIVSTSRGTFPFTQKTITHITKR